MQTPGSREEDAIMPTASGIIDRVNQPVAHARSGAVIEPVLRVA